jgi:hypothetical protein
MLEGCMLRHAARGQFKTVRTRELEVDGREGELIIYHGVMLKVVLESDRRFHSADGEVTA